MSKVAQQPLPFAPDRQAWSWIERSELGVHGTADIVLRVPAPPGEDVALPPRLQRALPLLLHERQALEACQPGGDDEHDLGLRPSQVLRRVVPRLLNFRWVESEQAREFVFSLGRPSSLHVLGRVLGGPFKFRLEDLSHFATHGELVVEALERLGIDDALDPEAILYCPALDSPFPFKFMLAGQGGPNRATYLRLLSRILRQTEPDETFRARQFRELTRGFQKFGPAAATPQFQEVELRLWRLLSYLAARLRVKAGRLTDTDDPEQAGRFLRELRDVHRALDDLEHLPSRLAALFRSRFDLELERLWEMALPELDAIARRIDCDLTDRERSIDAVASLVAEFRRLGSASPLECLEEKDREIKLAYGDVEPEPLETGWARTYDAAIYTGAARFDVRRFGADRQLAVDEGEEDLDLELDFLERRDDGGEAAEAAEAAEVEAEPEPEPELSDSASDWRVLPGAEWSMGGETDIDLDAVLGSDDGSFPPADDTDEGPEDDLEDRGP